MPLALTLRQRVEVVPFVRQLAKLLTVPCGDTLWLCSGYFADFVLDENPHLTEALAGEGSPRHIRLVGGMFQEHKAPAGTRNSNYQFFKNFGQKLQTVYGKTLEMFEAKTLKWHGKIAMRLDGTRPTAAIIGSSNLTQPAAKEGHPEWNFEADVAIWIPELDDPFQVKDRSIADDEYALLFLDPNDPLREAERLSRLAKILDDLVRDGTLKPVA